MGMALGAMADLVERVSQAVAAAELMFRMGKELGFTMLSPHRALTVASKR